MIKHFRNCDHWRAPNSLPELSLQIGPAEGLEDQPIALSIAADLAQANGAVTIGVQLGNVPTDATLVTGTGQVLTGSASYTLTPGGSGYDFSVMAGGLSSERLTASSNALQVEQALERLLQL